MASQGQAGVQVLRRLGLRQGSCVGPQRPTNTGGTTWPEIAPKKTLNIMCVFIVCLDFDPDTTNTAKLCMFAALMASIGAWEALSSRWGGGNSGEFR